MSGSRMFFIIFAALIAVVGLVTAAWASDYLRTFGFGLFGFGALFAFSCVKRHFDEIDGIGEP
jgi:hypothetical protein